LTTESTKLPVFLTAAAAAAALPDNSCEKVNYDIE